MNFEERVAAFEKLGNYINAIDEAVFNEVAIKARNENSWFTPESIRLSLQGLSRFLNPEKLQQWLSRYDLTQGGGKIIAVVMAGNIPLVGFHDLLCVLVSGNTIQVKPSSKDRTLLLFVIEKLLEIEPRFGPMIQITERMKNFDAVIATGSDNSARYFDYYFSKYPHVIRKNRSSCAVLSGFESDDELQALGADVFAYFGLGCRNVSKIYVPENYDFGKLIRSWQPYESVMMHHKYHNNYDYQKSILLVNRVPFLESGFCLFQESERLVSPISVIYFEYYNSWDAVLGKIQNDEHKIQCVVGNIDHANVKIGQTQYPELWDYADRVDILKFLLSLN
jgi:hypothetical protein